MEKRKNADVDALFYNLLENLFRRTCHCGSDNLHPEKHDDGCNYKLQIENSEIKDIFQYET